MFNKEAQLLVAWISSELWLTKILMTRLCTINSFKNLFKLVVFLNGYEHIEVLLNPCKITQDQKVWNTISRLHPSHIKNVLGGDSKRPMERKQDKWYITFKSKRQIRVKIS